MELMELLGLDSRWLYSAVVGIQVAERGWELILSRRNAARTLARGGLEQGLAINWLVIVLHVAWLSGALLEVWLLPRPLIPVLAVVCGILLVPAMAVRGWAMRSLGDRWNIRVIAVPGEAPARSGPYRWFRHPNYLGVYVELFALPLLHSAWLTAVFLGVPHAIAIWIKGRIEERVLQEVG